MAADDLLDLAQRHASAQTFDERWNVIALVVLRMAAQVETLDARLHRIETRLARRAPGGV